MTELAAPDAKRKAARVGALAGLVAGPVFLASVALNTWASLDYLHGLGWEFVGTEDVPWPSSLARGPHAWEQIATFVVTACSSSSSQSPYARSCRASARARSPRRCSASSERR